MSDDLSNLIKSFQDATKHLFKERSGQDFLVIEFGFQKIVLPFDDGITLLKSLKNVEHFQAPYEKPPSIGPLDRTGITITIMSREEYENIKIAALLDISVDEAKQLRKLTITPENKCQISS